MSMTMPNLIGVRVAYSRPDRHVDGRGVVIAVQPYVNIAVGEDGQVGAYDVVDGTYLVTVRFDSGTMSGTSAGFAVAVSGDVIDDEYLHIDG